MEYNYMKTNFDLDPYNFENTAPKEDYAGEHQTK